MAYTHTDHTPGGATTVHMAIHIQPLPLPPTHHNNTTTEHPGVSTPCTLKQLANAGIPHAPTEPTPPRGERHSPTRACRPDTHHVAPSHWPT
eukprot:11027153-Prorocentrum_lima.AAC.1